MLDFADGRQVAYSDWGSADAPTVLYCHGYPSSRRELLLTAPILVRSGLSVRVVALNRPGYGPSTFKELSGFSEWSSDVSEAADKLGIGRFAVIGGSGGCPFALACGHELGDRISRISIVAGTAPVEANGMGQAPGLANIPTSPLLRRIQFWAVATVVRTRLRDRLATRIQRDLGGVDRAVLQRPELRNWYFDLVREAFAGGGVAASSEAPLYLNPWDFDLGRVSTETLLWYGARDTMVPASAGRWLADRLPDSSFTLWPHHGHFSWAVSEEAIEVIAATIAPETLG